MRVICFWLEDRHPGAAVVLMLVPEGRVGECDYAIKYRVCPSNKLWADRTGLMLLVGAGRVSSERTSNYSPFPMSHHFCFSHVSFFLLL